jgi:hypothetical protein
MVEDQMKADPFGLGRKVLQTCLILMICLSILAPPIASGGTFPFLKVEQVLIPILFLLYAWLLMTGMVPMFRFNGMFVIGTAFTFSVLLSIWYGAIVLAQNVVMRDFYEIPKLWFPVIFFTMAYESKFSQRALGRLFYAYGLAILLVCFYAWAQWIGLPLTVTVNSYYSAGVHDEALYLTRRVYSTMGNPNVLGLLLSWAVVCFTLALFARVGNRVWSGLILLSSVVTIAMTASRSGLMSAAVGIVLVVVLNFSSSSSFSRKRAVQVGLLLLLSSVIILITFQVVQSNPNAVSRYQELKHPGQVDSLRQRLDDLWLDALADFGHSPLLGFGPAKIRFGGIITDSEYLDVLKQFGILGFVSYISYFLYPFFFLWKGLRIARKAPPLEPKLKIHAFAVRFTFIMVTLALLINVGASTFYSPFLQGFLWLWFGIGVRSARTIGETVETVPWLSRTSMAIPSLFDRPAHDV